jgi:hypothetical protein
VDADRSLLEHARLPWERRRRADALDVARVHLVAQRTNPHCSGIVRHHVRRDPIGNWLWMQVTVVDDVPNDLLRRLWAERRVG